MLVRWTHCSDVCLIPKDLNFGKGRLEWVLKNRVAIVLLEREGAEGVKTRYHSVGIGLSIVHLKWTMLDRMDF